MMNFLTGGFAKGYRTYILVALSATSAVVLWAVGDKSLEDTAQALWQIALTLGVGTARSAIAAQNP